MSEEQVLIEPLTPNTPNIPPETTLLPLHPITLWPVASIKNVYTLPGEIDNQKLIRTIQKLTSTWPIIVGRFVKTGDREYAIKMTTSPFPFTKAILHQESVYPSSNVIQPSLAPFPPSLSDSYSVPDSDSPLVSIKVTTLLPSRCSVIGITWSHLIGDGATCHEFVSQLSLLYAQNEESMKVPLERYPSFFPHISLPRYPPTPEAKERWRNWYNAPVPITGSEGMLERYKRAIQECEIFTLTLRREEVKTLKRKVQEGSGAIHLSEQDCLSAWWIHVIECSGTGTKMKKVGNFVNLSHKYRHLGGTHPSYFPANLSTLSANVVQMIGTSLESPIVEDPMDRIRMNAIRIRKTLMDIRNKPEDTVDWLSVSASQVEESIVSGQAQCIVAPVDECMVNSTLRYDSNQPFGFPWDQTAFHTSSSLPRHLRVFHSNPKKGEEKGETDVELCWSVRKGSKDAVERVVERERDRWMR